MFFVHKVYVDTIFFYLCLLLVILLWRRTEIYKLLTICLRTIKGVLHILPESLMYYWENRKNLDGHSNVLAYVLTVVKHKCLDHLRKMRTREDFAEYLQNIETRRLNVRIATLEACNPERIFSDELQSLVDKALASLPEQTRDVFIRSRYNNQSHKEIAEALGISTKTVEFHITKALKVLRVALKDYLPVFLYLLMK